MRQFLCGLLAAALLLSLCACAPEAPSQRENDPPPVTEPEGYERVDWLVISLDPEDYGIVYDIDHMNVRDFPLAKLCVYCLYADGAYAEGAPDEVYGGSQHGTELFGPFGGPDCPRGVSRGGGAVSASGTGGCVLV